MAPAFSFRDTWLVPGGQMRVQALLLDLEHYADWWPQVLAVAKVTDDDARVLCRSVLPYTLDLLLHAVHREPDLLETSLEGDLTGRVRWRLSAAPGGTRLDFEQDVVVTGRGVGTAARLVRPVLRWNHDRMMAGCIAGLRRELMVPSRDAAQVPRTWNRSAVNGPPTYAASAASSSPAATWSANSSASSTGR